LGDRNMARPSGGKLSLMLLQRLAASPYLLCSQCATLPAGGVRSMLRIVKARDRVSERPVYAYMVHVIRNKLELHALPRHAWYDRQQASNAGRPYEAAQIKAI